MVMVVLEALELALLGVASLNSKGSDARREGSYSVQTGGIVVRYISTVLASLGLNTYLRDKGGEGWDGARRCILPRGSCEILKS